MTPRSGALRRSCSRDELRDTPQLVQFFNDFIDIDGLRPLAKLVTPIEILDLLIGVQNSAIRGISRQQNRVQKPGKEFGLKTVFLDGLTLTPFCRVSRLWHCHW